MRRDFDRRLWKLEAASGCAEVRSGFAADDLAGIKRRELLTLYQRQLTAPSPGERKYCSTRRPAATAPSFTAW